MRSDTKLCSYALVISVLVLLGMCIIQTSQSSSSLESPDIKIEPIALDTDIVPPLQPKEAARLVQLTDPIRFHDPKLHPSHYRYYFNTHPGEAEACRHDPTCRYKDDLDTEVCWGYEDGCHKENMSGYPKLEKFIQQWFSTPEAQVEQFWMEGDFGYLKKILQEGWYNICSSNNQGESSLTCIDNVRACIAKNLFVDLTNLKDPAIRRGRLDTDYFLTPGIIGGHCALDRSLLQQHSGMHSPLQSWFGELQQFTPFSSDYRTPKCDTVIEGRTFLMKMDAGINMYHHFCDFVNLYITQHLINEFSLNVTIVMWDTSAMAYYDLFDQTWQAFSDHPILQLNMFAGKKVCFRDAVLTLSPRMIRGFFYNMPLTQSVWGSSLMRAFTDHVLHRLGVKQNGPLKSRKLRITLLDRRSKHRNILNQNELVEALKKNPNYEVKTVVYNREIPFREQLQITHDSDIFISMHGAGLTHLLFLPDWAVIFEISNCEDKNCYYDLARLRGIHYITWENNSLLKKENEVMHPSLNKPHAKFCDYSFDKDEFIRLVKKAEDYVSNHAKYNQILGNDKDEL